MSRRIALRTAATNARRRAARATAAEELRQRRLRMQISMENDPVTWRTIYRYEDGSTVPDDDPRLARFRAQQDLRRHGAF